MVDGVENPYRTDREADALFVGRNALIAELVAAVRDGRNAIRAVMGGRGMGKSSLARQLEKRLGSDALTVVVSGNVRKVASVLGRALKVDLNTDDPVDALVQSARQPAAGRVAIILDEVERVLGDPAGILFLDNLREAYERAAGSLALLILGGTGVRDLLMDEASPFLRIAGGIHTLTGLERNEAATLIREPLRIDVPDDVVDALWAETAGHPWLLQMFMELAVQRATRRTEVVAQLPVAIRDAETRLHSIAFPMWWDNLRERGRDVYRRIARQSASVLRPEWVGRFGNDPRPWLEVLASTGLVALDEGAVLARGTLFQRWVQQNHPEVPPAPAPDEDALDAWLTTMGVDPFERLVVRSLAAWARATVEFPAAALQSAVAAKNDNSALQPEAFFQMHSVVALLQHERDLTAEPEALSMKSMGRSDIKVRSRHDATRRACVELKIFGRKDAEVVKQVMGYAAPGDTFAAVISIDRCKRPMRPAFEMRCFAGAPYDAKHDAPARVLQPVFCTEHAREGYSPLRVWHFLVELKDA
jgi:hypothetical protein